MTGFWNYGRVTLAERVEMIQDCLYEKYAIDRSICYLLVSSDLSYLVSLTSLAWYYPRLLLFLLPENCFSHFPVILIDLVKVSLLYRCSLAALLLHQLFYPTFLRHFFSYYGVSMVCLLGQIVATMNRQDLCTPVR